MENSWEENFSKFIANVLMTVLWGIPIIVIGVMADNKSVSDGIAVIFMTGAGIISGYYAIKAAWFGLISIAWPILLLLGIASVEAVKKLDEGGLKSVSDRIWHGKNGPPKS